MEGASAGSGFALGVLAGLGIACAAYVAITSVQATRAPCASPDASSPVVGRASVPFDLEDDVLAEQFTRNTQFFGEDSQRDICNSYVVVVGLGGVGSHAAHMLLRAGVGTLKLIDFDQTTLSSLNRHAVATRADVGLPKAVVLARHFREIVPEAKVEPVVAMFTSESAAELLDGPRKPDFLVDAIDNVDTKTALLAACVRRAIPVLSVGAAGAKSDPTRLRFLDISEASLDALAKLVRHKLRRFHGIENGVQVLFSTEKPRVGLTPIPEAAANNTYHEFQTIPNFRVRSIPVLGTAPAIFGMAAASWVLCHLARRPYDPEPVYHSTRKQYEALLADLQAEEEARCGHCDDLHVDYEEMVYIVSSIWRGVSALKCGVGDLLQNVGQHRKLVDLRLTRFDPSRPATPDNLILLHHEEADELHALGCAAWRDKHPRAAQWASANQQRLKELFG